MPRTRPLDAIEIRLLGALLEKQQATPEYYPLTLSALLAACNQKSNRQPVMALGEEELRDALERLRRDVLVWRVESARSDRWEHRLDSRWQLDPARKAVMTLLLLRGAQTPGELRSRSGRLHPFSSTSEVEETLRGLAVGQDALVVELPRQPGQRERRWRHLVGTETVAGEENDDEPGVRAETVEPAPEARSHLEARVAALERRVAELESRLGRRSE